SWAPENAFTWLAGGWLSSRLFHGAVFTAGGSSKIMDAALLIDAPLGRECSGRTVNRTLPSPWGGATLGGRKPWSGAGVAPVLATTDLKYQTRMWVNGSRDAATSTRMSFAGRRSTEVDQVFSPGGGISRTLPNVIASRLTVVRSNLVLSS